ncbi:hypothetical protein DYBT9275_02887 [Dyadobacter sp. CECT 9275]|uniref:Uncharacterized protein n=1 Tax=Dyadobacter helix TaxID=2822344 RepID=A0A916NLR7_9BACT|nr:hypothetical protein DYBT9275_02887 [Dyadobacter sp. CECT 9275]
MILFFISAGCCSQGRIAGKTSDISAAFLKIRLLSFILLSVPFHNSQNGVGGRSGNIRFIRLRRELSGVFEQGNQ